MAKFYGSIIVIAVLLRWFVLLPATPDKLYAAQVPPSSTIMYVVTVIPKELKLIPGKEPGIEMAVTCIRASSKEDAKKVAIERFEKEERKNRTNWSSELIFIINEAPPGKCAEKNPKKQYL